MNQVNRLAMAARPWHTHIAVFLTCWLVFLFHIGPWPGVNENRYLDLTMGMVDEGTFRIDKYHHNTVDKSYYDGHYYTGAPPGPAVLAVPAYVALELITGIIPVSLFDGYDKGYYIREQVGGKSAPDSFVASYPFSDFVIAHIFLVALVPAFLAALSATILFQFGLWLSLNRNRAIMLAMFYAFATPIFFYATRFYAHAASSFCLLLCFFLVFGIRQNHLSARWAIVSALFLGMAGTMEYTNAPLMGVLGIYMITALGPGIRLRAALASTVPILLLAGYHWYCFDNPLTTPFSLPMSPDDPGPHVDQMNVGIGGFGLPTATALWGLTFSPFRGVFTYAPILLIAIIGVARELYQETCRDVKLLWIIVGAAFLSQLLFNGAMLRFWWGGYVFGPRYLVPMFPLLIVGLVPAFRYLPTSVIPAAGAVGILINWTGTQYIVSQNAFSSIGRFLLSGPTTQFYEFTNQYFQAYSEWQPVISPTGGYLVLALTIVLIWRVAGRSDNAVV